MRIVAAGIWGAQRGIGMRAQVAKLEYPEAGCPGKGRVGLPSGVELEARWMS